MACSHLHRQLALVFLLCLLAFPMEKADGTRNIESPRNLKEVEVVSINSRKGSEALSSSFDLQSRTSIMMIETGGNDSPYVYSIEKMMTSEKLPPKSFQQHHPLGMGNGIQNDEQLPLI